MDAGVGIAVQVAGRAHEAVEPEHVERIRIARADAERAGARVALLELQVQLAETSADV
jgi:hypothetical protein